MNTVDRFSLKLHKLLTHLDHVTLPACRSCAQPLMATRGRRLYSSLQASTSCLRTCALEDRGLIRVDGPDSSAFLQGLFTNDINLISHCKESHRAMYTLLLNVQGRVLYDMIVYNTSEAVSSPRYLLECDQQVTNEFINLMKKYKIRRKVDIAEVSDEIQTWAAFPEDGSTACEGDTSLNMDGSVITVVPDPRLARFGQRLLLKKDSDGAAEFGIKAADEKSYRIRRYQWGVGEGVTDLPPGNCFPLESNVEFLNGVSFSKGCYIGQELTARTYHTGVTRKRLMPITLHSEDTDLSEADGLVNSAGKSSGKFRSACGKFGLALLRINDVIAKQPLVIQNSDGKPLVEAATHMPEWWPQDSDEELKKATAQQKAQT